MRQLIAKIVFKGENAVRLSQDVKNYLMNEFVDRRQIFVDMVNPMYEKWNKEFDAIYPGKDGYSVEYMRFIYNKHRKPLQIANDINIGLNEVKLCSDFDDNGDIYGYVEKIGVCIYLALV